MSPSEPIEHLAFPNESPAYRTARNALLESEMELRRQVERVAAQRRAMPAGGVVEKDYRFVGQDGPKKLSELFVGANDTVVIYSFMYGPERKTPCVGCTHFLDGLDGQTLHIDQRVPFYVVAKSPLARLQELATDRSWTGLHLLSTDGQDDYDHDYFGDSKNLTPAMRKQQDFTEGKVSDMPMLNVFRRQDGKVRHFWGSELLYAPAEPGQEYRHNDQLDPLWNLLDVTPEGRGDFHPKLRY